MDLRRFQGGNLIPFGIRNEEAKIKNILCDDYIPEIFCPKQGKVLGNGDDDEFLEKIMIAQKQFGIKRKTFRLLNMFLYL